MKRYETEKEIFDVVEAFENATISREDWKHAEHLTVALYYLLRYDFDSAYAKMRAGIFKLLKAFEVDFSKEMPYHETLTVFWLRTVDDFRRAKTGISAPKIYNEMIENFDKNYPLEFYSRDRLFSDEARRNFIEADLRRN